jgi:hypothetical protein
LLDVTVHGAVRGDARALTAARASDDRGRGRLIQYQTLGAMKQLQRLGAMSQTLGTMTQTLGTLPDGSHGQSGEPDAPRQQPQQQQQAAGSSQRALRKASV